MFVCADLIFLIWCRRRLAVRAENQPAFAALDPFQGFDFSGVVASFAVARSSGGLSLHVLPAVMS